MTETQAFWDAFYSENLGRWSGLPNAAVVAEATPLTPGTALELGCGDGADAIWLALRGWRVTAVDVSEIALAAAERAAAAAGVAGAIAFEPHDLAVSMPAGPFDLVTTAFLHSPVELPREEVLRQAADAVAPGGRLVVIGHAGPPPWAPPEHAVHGFPSPQEVLDALDLPPTSWSTERLELVERTADGPHGRTGVLEDSLVVVRRLT